MTTTITAAEYQQLLKEAGGNPRKIRLPEPKLSATHPSLPDSSDPMVRSMITNYGCWCRPSTRATAGEESVVLMVATRDAGELAGVTLQDGHWVSLTTWSPAQARALARQLLDAADRVSRAGD